MSEEILREIAEQVAYDAGLRFTKKNTLSQEDFDFLKKCVVSEIMVAFKGLPTDLVEND